MTIYFSILFFVLLALQIVAISASSPWSFIADGLFLFVSSFGFVSFCLAFAITFKDEKFIRNIFLLMTIFSIVISIFNLNESYKYLIDYKDYKLENYSTAKGVVIDYSIQTGTRSNLKSMYFIIDDKKFFTDNYKIMNKIDLDKTYEIKYLKNSEYVFEVIPLD